MTERSITGIVAWLKNWFHDKEETDNSDVEYLETTHGTTATGSWTATSTKLTKLEKGTKIFLKLTSNGSGNATLNLTLANGTQTGAKNIRWSGDTNLTTHFGAGTTIGLVYDGTVWRMVTPPSYGVNNNNSYLYGGVQIKSGSTALTTQTFCGAKNDGLYYKLTSGMILDTRYPIIFTQGAINANTSSNNVSWVNLNGYTTNTGFTGWTYNPPKMVYLEGTAYSKGLFTISSTVLTQTLTNGRYYIEIGEACATNNTRFRCNMTVYYYNGSNLIPISSWDGITDKPSTFTPSSHSHGSLANGGTLNSDITSVNKVAVTDSNNNLKTISKIPFANLNINKSDITGLGVVGTETGKALFPSSEYNIGSTTSFQMYMGRGQYQNLYTFLNELKATSGTLVDTYAPKNHATSNSTYAGMYGKASTTNWGHVKLDSEPTANSTNAVTSAGILSAIEEKADEGHTHTASESSYSPNQNDWGEYYQGVNNVNSALNTLIQLCNANALTLLDNVTANNSNPVKSSGIYTALSGKSDTNHTHDSRYYTETEIDSKFGWSTTEIGNSSVKGYIDYNDALRLAYFYLYYSGTASGTYYADWRKDYGLTVPNNLLPVRDKVVIPGHKNGTILVLKKSNGNFDFYIQHPWTTPAGITFTGSWRY